MDSHTFGSLCMRFEKSEIWALRGSFCVTSIMALTAIIIYLSLVLDFELNQLRLFINIKLSFLCLISALLVFFKFYSQLLSAWLVILMFNKFCSIFSWNHGLSLKFNLLDSAREKIVLFGKNPWRVPVYSIFCAQSLSPASFVCLLIALNSFIFVQSPLGRFFTWICV